MTNEQPQANQPNCPPEVEQREQQSAELEQQLQKQIKSKQEVRKTVIKKVIMYFIETLIIIWITSQIDSPIWAIVIGIIGAMILTKTFEYLTKRFETWYQRKKGKNLTAADCQMPTSGREVRRDYGRDFGNSIASKWSMLPDAFKDNLVGLVFKGESVKLFFELRKMQAYKQTISDFLAAKQALREYKYNTAKKLFEEVLQKAQKMKIIELIDETKFQLQKLEVSS